MLKSRWACSGLVVVAAAFWLAGCGDKSEPEPEPVTVEQVTIEFPRDTSDMPLSWRMDEETEIVAPLPRQQTGAAAKILTAAIARYPDEFLHEHLTNVFVYSDMYFGGQESTAGVSAGPSSVHLSYNQPEPYRLEFMFHWLVAELLYYKHPELVEQVAFDYPMTVPEKELADVWVERDVTFLKRGYLFSLGARSLEEDFGTIAAALMAGSRSALQDAKDYKLIGEKMAKVKKFFLLLDERFTEDFFRQQSEGERGHRGY